MNLPKHATDWHKFLISEAAQKFIKEYTDLCKRHGLCITADAGGGLLIEEFPGAYKNEFEPWQNCTCPECDVWWKEQQP